MLLLLLLLLSTLAGWPEPRESNKALHISLNLPDVLGPPPRESGAALRASVDAIVVCHVSEITSK